MEKQKLMYEGKAKKVYETTDPDVYKRQASTYPHFLIGGVKWCGERNKYKATALFDMF